MGLLIITGMSGAGKSKTINILEDMGYYCIDNVPPRLLPYVADFALRNDLGVQQAIDGKVAAGWQDEATKPITKPNEEESFLNKAEVQKVAVTIDTRSREMFQEMIPVLDILDWQKKPYRLLFVDCDESVLLKRYKESRRPHPLMGWNASLDLTDALKEERAILSPLKQKADFLIDTSIMSTTQLREELVGLFAEGNQEGMHIRFVAFGYKYGILADADIIFDVRCLANPYYVEELRTKTGEDEEVRNFVRNTPEFDGLFKRMTEYLEYSIPLYVREGKSQLIIGLGCTGGQHRSVTFACLLKEYFEAKGMNAHAAKRDMQKNRDEVARR